MEAKRTEGSHAGKVTVEEGISQHLCNQRPDEIPHLFAHAQLLLAISETEGPYGTTHTAVKFWAGWREEEFDDAHVKGIKNLPLSTCTRAALFAGKPARLASYFDALWAQSMQPTDPDRLLASLLTPARLLEFLRGYVLFDRKVGKIVARYQQFFGIRALIARWISQHLDAVRIRLAHVLPREYVSGESLMYLGRRYRLKVLITPYVVLHELCHLHHHNHSPRFCRELDCHMPGWRDIKERLDEMAEQVLRV